MSDESWKWRGMPPIKAVRALVVQPSNTGVELGGLPVTIIGARHPDDTKLIGLLAELLQDFIDNTSVPEANCSCHISPPCNDCVDNGGMRELIDNAQSAVDKAEALIKALEAGDG